MSKNKHIALITTWFPPQQSVATNRMLAFAEYLSLNYEVEVFALMQEEKTIKWNKNVLVHYSATNDLFEFLKDKQSDGRIFHKIKVGTRILMSKFIKNPLEKWQKSTLAKLKETHEKKPFDCIISSFSPQEAHLIAIEFKKEFPNVPWIADMRDEMSANPYIDSKTKLNLSAIEKQVDAFADAVTSVSEPILSDFKNSMPTVKYFEEIRNGFNHDFTKDKGTVEKNEVFTLGYFGTFYGSIKPINFFKALKEIKEKDLINFQVHLVGVHTNFSIPKEIESNVHILPSCPYHEAIEQMFHSSCNILINPGGKRKGVYTGKLFDYISVQKPVLAFVNKQDVAAKLIEDFDCGYIAEFSDVEENKKIILEAYKDWKENKIKFASDQQVQSLHRKEQVEKLHQLIMKLTA